METHGEWIQATPENVNIGDIVRWIPSLSGGSIVSGRIHEIDNTRETGKVLYNWAGKGIWSGYEELMVYEDDDPCEGCMAGACSDCCDNCSIKYPEGTPSNRAGEVTIMGKRDEYGGL